MCGIVGLVGRNDRELVWGMNERLRHRGPDDYGEYFDEQNQVSLAMRRLSIIDLVHGHQPMANEDDTLWVVCNGEIYNSPELRAGLLARGHRFKTRNSDVEVLLHLYEEKGQALVHELNGMYAFVIYDKAQGIIFGARDRMGIKPFYYTTRDGKFAFASELKSLLVLPWVRKDIHSASLSHYLSLQFVPAPLTIFSDVEKLPAGHFFIYNVAEKTFRREQYWRLEVNKTENRSRAEWREVIRREMNQAVNRWTLSDVPVACSLSGGLDSSSLVAFLAQSGVKDLRTYSLGFAEEAEQGCNELPLARQVAERWGTRHQEVVLKAEEVLRDLKKMVWHMDEPYAGGLPSWYIYELVGRDVKVCLTGTGGDELFGNYGKWTVFQKPGWYRLLKNIKQALGARSWALWRDGLAYPAGHFYPRYFADALKNELCLDDAVGPGEGTEAMLEAKWQEAASADPENSVAYVDFAFQLPEEFLAVSDRFSMAHSVEARVPFLDHQLVELVFQMPAALRAPTGNPKGFLKEIVGDLLPRDLLTAPKRGFVLPLEAWLRRELQPMVRDVFAPGYLKEQKIFSSRLNAFYVQPFLKGDHSRTQQVWTLFMFQLWYQSFLRPGPESH